MIWAAIPALMKVAGGIMGGTAASQAGGIMGGAGTAGARPGGGIMPFSGQQVAGGGPGTPGGRPGGGMTPYSGGSNPMTQSLGEAPTMPQNPGAGYEPGDVSGFANYGMEAPGLPDPTKQITGLMGMGMANNPHQNRKEDPFQQQQPGGLMAYLQALSRS
jgi:hypothetical protein